MTTIRKNIHSSWARSAAIGIALVVASLVMGGCTHNDGDIGPLFGTWRLDRLTLENGPDGKPVDAEIEMMWSFQNSVVCFQTLKPEHVVQENWASWSKTDTELIFRFDNSDDKTPPGSWPYIPPAGMGISYDATRVAMHIEVFTRSRMELSYTNPATGHRYHYSLTKYL